MKLESGMAAVVTGGASGLGRASAQALADQGLKVAIFDINDEDGEAHAKAIGGTFHHVDIMDEQSVEDGFAAAREANGQERVTVHCAMASRRGKTLGWDKENGRYKRLPTEDYAFGAEGILIASYRIASISALGMANSEPLNEDGERGCITLTASVAAQDGQIGQVIYGSCKSGVNGLVLPMARDLMDIGIRINSVMPGIFATPLMLGMKDRNPAMWAQLNASVPFPKRLGHPEEFASLICEIA
ncbi:MAG: SDR family oxidoreductase, partial [Altererythrobacter sp.]|nr:SDR family oxidoreductase [Altererythrobacter sp.]